jgi:hypothetical protein
MEGHRKVMKDLAREWCYYPLKENGMPLVEYAGKPCVMDVHHFNGDSTDNRVENLTYLQRCIHARISKHKGVRDPKTGRWMSWKKWADQEGEDI